MNLLRKGSDVWMLLRSAAALHLEELKAILHLHRRRQADIHSVPPPTWRQPVHPVVVAQVTDGELHAASGLICRDSHQSSRRQRGDALTLNLSRWVPPHPPLLTPPRWLAALCVSRRRPSLTRRSGASWWGEGQEWKWLGEPHRSGWGFNVFRLSCRGSWWRRCCCCSS